jgi:hypothetical protein
MFCLPNWCYGLQLFYWGRIWISFSFSSISILLEINYSLSLLILWFFSFTSFSFLPTHYRQQNLQHENETLLRWVYFSIEGDKSIQQLLRLEGVWRCLEAIVVHHSRNESPMSEEFSSDDFQFLIHRMQSMNKSLYLFPYYSINQFNLFHFMHSQWFFFS